VERRIRDAPLPGKAPRLKATSFAYFSWQDKKSETVRQDRKTQVITTVTAPVAKTAKAKRKAKNSAF
jgi:hypothetical protein